jgi:hypothetical protein
MMPYLHAKQSSDAATNDCQYQQGYFRYAPTALLGLPLVNAIDQEGHNIDNYQVI